jgi:hypothetical protein
MGTGAGSGTGSATDVGKRGTTGIAGALTTAGWDSPVRSARKVSATDVKIGLSRPVEAAHAVDAARAAAIGRTP